jgi:hypothetical protein
MAGCRVNQCAGLFRILPVESCCEVVEQTLNSLDGWTFL